MSVPSGYFGSTAMKWIIPIAFGIGILFAAYKLNYPDYIYRYRLNLTIEVDGQPRTGSSVIEVRWIGGPSIANYGSYAADGDIRGQAPIIDLGDRGILIASLMNGDAGSTDDALSALWLCARAFNNDSSYGRLPELVHKTGRRDLIPGTWPRLMWLPNRLEPATAQKIGIADITKVFGADARITSAFVEMTSDPIAIDIESKLPWFRTWAEAYNRKLPIYDPQKIILRPNMLIGGA